MYTYSRDQMTVRGLRVLSLFFGPELIQSFIMAAFRVLNINELQFDIGRAVREASGWCFNLSDTCQT